MSLPSGGRNWPPPAVACLYYLGMQHFKVMPIRLSFSMPHAVGLIREGAAVGLSTFVWAAAQYMPLFLIGSLVGGARVGWYAAAQRLATSISMFGFVYHFNLYPALARSAAAWRQLGVLETAANFIPGDGVGQHRVGARLDACR